MKQLIKINGIKEIEGMKFHDIEGGFGEGKKAMLVKEIASIHGRDVGRINEAINRNRKRFKDGTDIIDLRWTEVAIDLCVSGIYTQNSINASSNIYLLSERGYAKLLKILEDDMAWEQYEKLVDGYFNMRADMKEQSKPTCIEDLIIMQAQSLKDMREQVNQANYHALEAKAEAEKSREEIQAMRDVVATNSNNWREDCRKLIVRIAQGLGGNGYISEVNKEIYALMRTRLKCKLDVQLTNMRRRMADEGVCKSKRDKLTKLDVIAKDNRLIEGYVAIVKELACRYEIGQEG